MIKVKRNNLRKWRLAKGITIKQLAQRTGYRYRYLVQLERGLSKGTPNTWIKLAQALEISVNNFFQETRAEYKININEQERSG